MAKIRLVDAADDDAAGQALKTVVGRRGKQANFYRMYANSPQTLAVVGELVWSLWSAHNVSRALIELTILRVSQHAEASYEWTHHVGMAQDAGLPTEKIVALQGWRTSRLFDDGERALLAVVDEMCAGYVVSAPVLARFQEHYAAAAVIDLMTVVGLYRNVAVMLNSFEIEAEDWAPDLGALAMAPRGSAGAVSDV